MVRGPERRRLPLAFFALALLGGVAMFAWGRCSETTQSDGLLERTRSRLDERVHQLEFDPGPLASHLPASLMEKVGVGLPRHELLVGPAGRFHLLLAFDEVWEFHLGHDGEGAWTWRSDDPRVLRLDDAVAWAESPASPLVDEFTHRVLTGWRRLQEALAAGDSEDPRRHLEIEDRVRRSADDDRLLWRLATRRARGGERLRIWVDDLGRLDRVEFGALEFRVREREDLGPESFEISRWIAGDTDSDSDTDANPGSGDGG